MNARTRCLGVTAACMAIGAATHQAAWAARHCVNFDDLVPGVPHTTPFASCGVNINVRPHHVPIGPCAAPTVFGAAQTAPFTEVPGATPPYSLNLENVRLDFTMADFHSGNPIRKLKLKYSDYGGNVNISVNGDCRSVVDFTDIPGGTVIGGVRYRRNLHRIVLKKRKKGPPINAFEISGQEFYIDDVCAWD